MKIQIFTCLGRPELLELPGSLELRGVLELFNCVGHWLELYWRILVVYKFRNSGF